MSAKRKAATAAVAVGSDGPDVKRRKLPVSTTRSQSLFRCAWHQSGVAGADKVWLSRLSRNGCGRAFRLLAHRKLLHPHQVQPTNSIALSPYPTMSLDTPHNITLRPILLESLTDIMQAYRQGDSRDYDSSGIELHFTDEASPRQKVIIGALCPNRSV